MAKVKAKTRVKTKKKPRKVRPTKLGAACDIQRPRKRHKRLGTCYS